MLCFRAQGDKTLPGMHLDRVLRTLFELVARLRRFFSGISGHADVWKPVRCAEELICQPYLQSIFTQSHEILKSKTKEPPKWSSSSGIEGTSAF